MTGSAFIIHNNTWSCSNSVVMGFFSDPVMDNGKVVAIKETKTLTVYGEFHATEPYKVGDRCEFVIMPDDSDKKSSWFAEVKAIGKLHTIINIFSKSDRISEILANITFKN